MFAQSRFTVHEKLEEEFNRPVESIMRCEDFKSNFARRLSHRHITKSPVSSPKQDTSLKLRGSKSSNAETLPDNVPERIEVVSQLSNSMNIEQNGETLKPPNRTLLKSSQIRNIEVIALNMEVETLRWQLSQTEANRQMHIALLRQIVTFLNRVKEHIEFQNNEISIKKEKPVKLLTGSFSTADLPRSKSVIHVNKHLEYTLNASKKISTRKISKSISNVGGHKECIDIWSQSKLSLTPDTDSTNKISEEMSRLISLANTVLSTNLPDLTCNESNTGNNNTQSRDNNDEKKNTDFNETASFTENEYNTDDGNESKISYDDLNSALVEIKEDIANTFIVPLPSPDFISDLEVIDLNEKSKQIPLHYKSESESSIIMTRKSSIEKRNDYNFTNFIEDESGFSSMNSFQEIGIPIISIIPPSPCKEVGYVEKISNILDESEKWKTDTVEQTVKVFWV